MCEVESVYKKGACIIFDTSFYLNIYEYSPQYREFSLNVIQTIENKLVMPSTVYREFESNYQRCFDKQKKLFKNFVSDTQNSLRMEKNKIFGCLSIFDNNKFPDMDDLKQSISNHFDIMELQFEEYVTDHGVLEELNNLTLKSDSIKELVDRIKSKDNIMDDLTIEEIYTYSEEASKNAKIRGAKVPGLKDGKKPGILPFNDFFIWKEILKYSLRERVDVIYVTDDQKNDWFEDDPSSGGKKLIGKYIDDFKKMTSQRIVGMTPFDFINTFSRINSVVMKDLIVYHMIEDSSDFISSNIYDIDEKLGEDLELNFTNYIYEFPNTIGSEGLGELFEIENIKYTSYNILSNNGFSIEYNLVFEVEIRVDSYEYYGRDDDTKEVILSDGKIHDIAGNAEVLVKRFAIKDSKCDSCYDYNYDDSYLEYAGIVNVNFNEVNSFEKSALCSKCGQNEGEYFDYEENLICSECYTDDSFYTTCTQCGKLVPRDYMASDNCCYKCIDDYNKKH